MGPAGRLTALWAWSVVACTEPTVPIPSRPHKRVDSQPGAVADQQACSGGLLCEDRASLGGFRVPRGCVRTYQGAMVAQCSIANLAPGGLGVREFLASRYTTVLQDGSALRVQVPDLGTLQVLFDGNSAHLTAISRELPLAVDTSPPQG